MKKTRSRKSRDTVPLISPLLSCRHCCCLYGWHLSRYHKIQWSGWHFCCLHGWYISLYTIRSHGLGWHRRCLNGFIYIFCGWYATLFTFIFFHTIHYTWLDHITQYMMRLGLADVLWVESVDFLGSHHMSNCDEAWAGWCLAWNRWSFKVTVSSGIFWPSSPTGIRTCDPHIRGSSRAVSEW